MDYILIFLLWTFCLYVIHVASHKFYILKKIHKHHHLHIRKHKDTKWHWSNLFLYNDNWPSTVDLWITEVLPTLVLAFFTGHWWIFVFYYTWAALFQENLEHNPRHNFYPLTFGQWHLVHHSHAKSNFGLFIPIWDIIFRTERSVNKINEAR